MIFPLRLSAAIPAALAFSEAEAEHASAFLGIPLWIWQIVNLVAFLGVLIYFVARPMAAAFRKRQLEIEQRRKEVDRQRGEVDRLSAEIRERTARLEREIEEIRHQGVVEGQSAREALSERAQVEADRVAEQAREEIQRRLAAAKLELRQTAADLTASSASAILSREITDEDRERLLTESVSRLKATR